MIEIGNSDTNKSGVKKERQPKFDASNLIKLASKLPKRILGKDKKLRSKIERQELRKRANERFVSYMESISGQQSGFLEAEDNETTRQFRNKDIVGLVGLQNSQQIYRLDLDFGRYSIDFSRNGQELLLAGSRGHVAQLEWKTKKLKCEFHVREKISDIKFLQNTKFMAVAQQKCVFIYDDQGIELHRLGGMHDPVQMEYLPYHYLLASISRRGKLVYQDVSTGDIISEIKTKTSDATLLRQNRQNGILFTGNNRGVVRLWSPNSGLAQASMFCHHAQISDLAVTYDGLYMATVGSDKKMKVWDMRTLKCLYEYWTPQPVYKCSASQKGLLALASKDSLIIWKDWYLTKQKAPFLKHDVVDRKMITDCQFSPFEDYIGLGLDGGFETSLVPGSAEANFDTFEEGINLSKKMKREQEVQKVLEKLPADTIALDPSIIGTMDERSQKLIQEELRSKKEEEDLKRLRNRKKKNKMRGKNVAGKEKLKKNNVREILKRKLVRTNNIKRLKARLAEKSKSKRELDELNNRITDLSAIPNQLKNQKFDSSDDEL